MRRTKLGRPAAKTFPEVIVAGKRKWMQVRTAAKTLGVHRTRIYQLIRSGEWETLDQHGLRWVLESQVKLAKIQREQRA